MSMKTHYRILLCLMLLVFGAFLLAPPTALAKGKTIAMEYDIITKDLDTLKEPGGVIKLKIDIPKSAAKYETQLREVVNDYFKARRDEIHKYMAEADKALKKNPKQHKKLAKNLNKLFADLLKDTRKGMQAAIDAEWKDIRKRDKALLKAKISSKVKSGVKAVGGLFTVVTSALRIGASSGGDVSAYFSLVSGTAKTAAGLYEFVKGPTFSNLGDLKLKIGQSTSALKMAAEGDEDIKEKHITSSAGELSKVLKSYGKALAGSQKKHANLVKRINKLLDSAEKLQKKGKSKKIQKAEDYVMQTIVLTEELGSYLQRGRQSYTDSKALLADSKKVSNAMKKGGKADAIKKIVNPGNLDKVAKFTATLAKQWPKAEKKAQQIVSFLDKAASVLK
jgi:hypothetical protein